MTETLPTATTAATATTTARASADVTAAPTPGGGATRTVPSAFDEAAPRYDVMVALNPGYHRHLRSAARALADGVGTRSSADGPVRVLDLGCGSGASTKALLSRMDGAEVVGVDASAGMLAVARDKSWPDSLRFVHGLAEDLTSLRSAWGLDEPVDGVLAAYLFRNVTARDDVLAAVSDVLELGGVLVVQEYSLAGSKVAALVWSLVCWLVVIPLSWATSRDTSLYRYLWRSVLNFDSVQRFADRLWRAGFVDVEVRTVPGWQRGILHTFRARKPAAAPDAS